MPSAWWSELSTPASVDHILHHLSEIIALAKSYCSSTQKRLIKCLCAHMCSVEIEDWNFPKTSLFTPLTFHIMKYSFVCYAIGLLSTESRNHVLYWLLNVLDLISDIICHRPENLILVILRSREDFFIPYLFVLPQHKLLTSLKSRLNSFDLNSNKRLRQSFGPLWNGKSV